MKAVRLGEAAGGAALTTERMRKQHLPQMGRDAVWMCKFWTAFMRRKMFFICNDHERDRCVGPSAVASGADRLSIVLGRACEEQKDRVVSAIFPMANREQAEEFVEMHYAAETMAEFQASCWDWRREAKIIGNKPILAQAVGRYAR